MRKILYWTFALVGLIGCTAFFISRNYLSNKTHRCFFSVVGPVNMADGLGRQAIEFVDFLKDTVSVQLLATHIENLWEIPDSIQRLIVQKTNQLGSVVMTHCCFATDGDRLKISHVFKKQSPPDQIRIAYSMTESDLIPPKWVESLNYYFDAVVVPDSFLVDVYKNSGVTKPIFVIPLGRDLGAFLKAPLKTKSHSPFVFGNLGAGIYRKNHKMLIRAFHAAFGNSPDVLLKINCRSIEPNLERKLRYEIKALKATNIELIKRTLCDREYLDFFHSIDVFVNFSKGEGYANQPREAMAMGIPTILTDNTAQHTICESGLVRSVPCNRKEAAFFEWSPAGANGSFFNCELKDAAKALREVKDNYDAYLQKSNEARIWATQFHFAQLKPLYLGLIKPKKVVLGDTNEVTEDCLFTNANDLYQKYVDLRSSSEVSVK